MEAEELIKKLRICHFPQIPCNPFIIEVKDLHEAKKISDILANYDLFQYENKIRPDYANITIVEEWDEIEQEWLSWCDDETGIDDLEEYFKREEYTDLDLIEKLEELGGKIIALDTASISYWNPFEIDIDKLPREEVLSQVKTIVETLKKVENVSYEFIKEIAIRNNFEITDNEIYNILND